MTNAPPGVATFKTAKLKTNTASSDNDAVVLGFFFRFVPGVIRNVPTEILYNLHSGNNYGCWPISLD